MNHTIKISMLGGFRLMHANGSVIDYQNNRSNKLWLVLAYLLTYRDKQITQDELIDILWGEEPIDNPANTLKTLRHRLCSMLDELGEVPGKDMIRYNHGMYSWNKELDCEIDIEQFIAYCNLGDEEENLEQKVSYYLTAIEYYSGDFLPKFSGELWVMAVHAYYHTEYLRVVKKCLTILKNEQRYYDIVTVCQKAVVIEPYDEELHRDLIHALVQTGAKQSALNHYENVKKMFYQEFGVNLSDELVELYKQIIQENHEYEMDLTLIQEQLQEANVKAGAFYCEYALFREIYRLLMRMIERNGKSAYLCLITVTDKKGKRITNNKLQNEAMGRLRTTIQFSLRRGDIFTRYSVSQYLVVLPSINYEDTVMVLNRILGNYRKTSSLSGVSIQTSIQPLRVSI